RYVVAFIHWLIAVGLSTLALIDPGLHVLDRVRGFLPDHAKCASSLFLGVGECLGIAGFFRCPANRTTNVFREVRGTVNKRALLTVLCSLGRRWGCAVITVRRAVFTEPVSKFFGHSERRSTRSLQGLESSICACVRRLIFAVLRAVGVFCRIYCVIVGIVWGFIFSHDLLLVQLVVQVRYCNRSGVAVCPYRFILHNSGAHHIVPPTLSMQNYYTPKRR